MLHIICVLHPAAIMCADRQTYSAPPSHPQAASAPSFGFKLLRVPPAELGAKAAILREAIPEFTPASVLM
jgi:hypothetical protein